MYTWTYYERIVFTKSAHEDISVPEQNVPDPTKNGYMKSIGDIDGQEADYEKAFEDGTRIHLKKYEECYLAHWDFFSPFLSPIQHLRYDAPEWYVLVTTAVGCGLGAGSTDDKVVGGIVGSVAGLLLGLLTLPKNSDQ